MVAERPLTIKELLADAIAAKASKLFQLGKVNEADILIDVASDLLEPKASRPEKGKSTPPEPKQE